MGIEKLHVVTPPKLDESVKQTAIAILKRVLAKAEAGDVSSLVIIWRDASDYWDSDMTALKQFPEWIGRIEIAKQEMIQTYLKQGQDK